MMGPEYLGRTRGKKDAMAFDASPRVAARRNIGSNVESVIYRNVAQYITRYATTASFFMREEPNLTKTEPTTSNPNAFDQANGA